MSSRIHPPLSFHLLPEDPFEAPVGEGVDKFSHSVDVVLVIYYFYVVAVKIEGFLGLPRISAQYMSINFFAYRNPTLSLIHCIENSKGLFISLFLHQTTTEMIDFFIRMSILQIAWIGILRIIEMSEEKNHTNNDPSLDFLSLSHENTRTNIHKGMGGGGSPKRKDAPKRSVCLE